ncbi:hypothetical protein THAOC_13529 [Thalassiosira oceanica]|uniref:DUF6743 domain-containing protein n=1 Tax=Thalassiosira oceanica TaxID=159749 RepID=K0T5C7_THAOC|nr:hypothetical protein THAOC_13529 [Thalassiosira oceanica]|eukprot:EJK65592.1 hypothetical protein THAOC_13529 [Thalassiosira oceanica]
MRTSKEWMREDTWHFEVEVLRIYGPLELWSHGFGARLVSDGPYQPVDTADVRRRIAFGPRQDNEFAVWHCCVHRLRWSVVSGTRMPRGTSKPEAPPGEVLPACRVQNDPTEEERGLRLRSAVEGASWPPARSAAGEISYCAAPWARWSH